MITVFSGTNRPNSLTSKYAKHCFDLMEKKRPGEVQYFSMEDMPVDCIHADMYSAATQSSSLTTIQDKYVLAADAFFIVSPEYNGSFPGILKTFIDACSIREYGKSFAKKKAGLLGVASGRAGNFRGLEHLTGIFHHMDCNVMSKALPLGQSNLALNEEGKIEDETMLKTLDQYVDKFLAYCEETITK